MHETDDGDTDGIDGSAIETLDHAAISIAGLVSQGRIGPTKPDDYEAETLLAHLAVLVGKEEAAARKLVDDQELLRRNREERDRLAKESALRQMQKRDS